MFRKSKGKKLFAMVAIPAVLLSIMTTAALAYYGTFSFNITTAVCGLYSHSLVANKALTLRASAVTNSSTVTLHYNCGIQRQGSLLSWGTGAWPADGVTRSYVYTAGRIIAGTYRVRVTVTAPLSSISVIGNGSLSQ